MKYVPLIWAGLWRRPVRTLFTSLSIVAAFMLHGTLHGVSAGLEAAMGRMSDTRLQIANRVNIIESLPLAYLSQIEALPNVEAVAYYQTLAGYYQDPRNAIMIGGIELERYLRIRSEVLLSGEQRDAMLRTRTGAIVGRDLADRYGWKLGDRLPLTSAVFPNSTGSYDWQFDIVGIYDFADEFEGLNSNEVWINYSYFDEERARGKGRVLFFLVGIADPQLSATVSEEIDAMFRNSSDPTQTLNEREFVRAEINQIAELNFFVTTVISAVLFTLLFLIANTMAQSIHERTPEMAVLKTCGYTDRTIAALVVVEALVLCVFSATVGLSIAAIIFPGVFERLGVGALAMPISVLFFGIVLALGLAALSVVPPAIRVYKLSVVDALAVR